MEEEFNELYETIIGNGIVKKEPCDTDDEPRSIHNYIGMKNESVKDPIAVVVQETGCRTDYADVKVCISETVIKREFVQKELCDMVKEQESVHNYNGIENEIVEDSTAEVTQEAELMTDQIDDKVDVYETVISNGYIKQEPCDMENNSGVVQESKIIEDLSVAIQESRHINNIKGNYFTCCKGCGEEYDVYCLKCHLVTHKDVKPFHYHTNGEQFQTIETLQDHVRNVHDEKKKKYKCLKCDFETIYQRNMKEHILTVHSDIKQFKCPRCAFKTCRRKSLNSHLRRHEEAKPIKCASCDIEFGEAQSFARHRKEVHAIVDNDDKPYACALCPYKTKINSQLKRHVFIHNDDKPYECTQCLYKAKRYSHLKRHIVIHTEDKPFACTVCSFKTKTNQQLRQHIAIHCDDKPFACTHCPYKTKTKAHLREHTVIHKDDKPFACIHCPYKTKTNAHLREHMAIHNEDISFACNHCSYKTKTKSYLKRHIVIHNDDKSFACTHCAYKARTGWQLKLHVAIHNDGKPFTCSLCSYETKINSNLKRHITLTHKDDNPFVSAPPSERRQSEN